MPKRSWVLSLCVAAGLAAGSVGPASADPSDEGCANRVNATSSKLVTCIQQADLWQHMQNFEAIAQANPGPDGHPSRNSGEPGYKASVDYVATLMQKAGYNVTIQTYKFPYYQFGQLNFQEASPTAKSYVLNTDWIPGQTLGAVSGAQLQAAGGILIPPTGGSRSGCSSADFTGFVPGRIALIQRGTCFFGVKVLNALAAGATGVVIFNEGNTAGRSGLFNATFQDSSGNGFVPTIPVALTTFAVGQDLYNQLRPGMPPVMMNLAVNGVVDPNRDDYNLIAESPGGDPDHVVVVDAHLDAIFGEGMLDNASGSAAILDIAQMMKKVTPLNKLRFIWFGGEELGLLGSTDYVNNLSSDDLSHIAYDLDADVFGTPNYDIGVLDPAAVDFFGRTVSTTFPSQVYAPSLIARDVAVNYFNSINKNHIFFSPVGTDAFNFNLAGIPASGLLTGQDTGKTQAEVNLFGGTVGKFEGFIPPNPPGGCVDNPFLWCDNLNNNDPAVLTMMSKAFATMVINMAFDTNLTSSSNSVVSRSKLPNPGHHVGKHFESQ
jgi:hypothetical protein